jgi:hypothetical protein
MKPDALKGVKHIIAEELRADVTLQPFEHYCPPEVPNSLTIRVYNMDPNRTYIVRIIEVTDSIKLPKYRSGK